MKNLFRQEWKYYLFFLVAILCFLYFHSGIFREIPVMATWTWDEETFESTWEYMDIEDYVPDQIEYDIGMRYMIHLIGDVSLPLLICILLLKTGIFWIEKDSYGREFFQSLPVRRVDRVRFHLLMDSLLIVVSLSVYGGIVYLHAMKGFAAAGLEIPWFGRSVFGIVVTDICYLLFLLGIINFLECLFVNGAIRLFGVLGCMGMSRYILHGILVKNEFSVLAQKLVGFAFMLSPGNLYYIPGKSGWWKYELTWDAALDWEHASLTPEIIYQGKPVEYTLQSVINNVYVVNDGYEYKPSTTSYFSWLYDYSKPGSYGGYALAYLILAVILIAVSIRLYEKQELSKEGMYFSFAKYIFSALVGVSAFFFMARDSEVLWHNIVSFLAAIIVFVIIVYALSPDRRKPFFAKAER